jgi:hypothetical protein
MARSKRSNELEARGHMAEGSRLTPYDEDVPVGRSKRGVTRLRSLSRLDSIAPHLGKSRSCFSRPCRPMPIEGSCLRIRCTTLRGRIRRNRGRSPSSTRVGLIEAYVSRAPSLRARDAFLSTFRREGRTHAERSAVSPIGANAGLTVDAAQEHGVVCVHRRRLIRTGFVRRDSAHAAERTWSYRPEMSIRLRSAMAAVK